MIPQLDVADLQNLLRFRTVSIDHGFDTLLKILVIVNESLDMLAAYSTFLPFLLGPDYLIEFQSIFLAPIHSPIQSRKHPSRNRSTEHGDCPAPQMAKVGVQGSP